MRVLKVHTKIIKWYIYHACRNASKSDGGDWLGLCKVYIPRSIIIMYIKQKIFAYSIWILRFYGKEANAIAHLT